ncbi:MAG: RIP metalloprotease [Solirubrobacterales bacterium]
MSWGLVFIGFCLLIILHEAGHFVAAKATGMRAEKFFLFMGPKIVSFRRGETEYGIAAIPIGGYVKITGMNPEEEIPPEVAHRAYYRQPVWKRIVVIAAGPAVNIALAFAIFCFAYLLYGQQLTPRIGEVGTKTPAAKVLKSGDRILAVDGHSYRSLGSEDRISRFREDIEAHKCAGEQKNGCLAATPVRLEIERNNQTQFVSVRPEYLASVGQYLMGVTFAEKPVQFSVGAASGRALHMMWYVTHMTASALSRLYEPKVRKQMSGIVGISVVGHEVVDTGTYQALLMLALVSLSLALMNLLPILPLDGGHIFWSLVEKVRGRPISLRTMYAVTGAGLAVVALLFIIGLSNDIGRLTGEGFHIR